MKANDVPEKLYLLPNEFISYCRNCDEDIEYTRTDAFVEKAVQFIRNNVESDKYITPDEESYRHGCPYDYFDVNMFIEDFKKYMKG